MTVTAFPSGIYALIYTKDKKIAKFIERVDEGGGKIRIFKGEVDISNIDKKDLISELAKCEVTNEKPNLGVVKREDLGVFDMSEFGKYVKELLDWFNENVKNVVNLDDYVIFINGYFIIED